MSYDRRNSDFKTWCNEHDIKPTAAIRAAFNAGWRARKHVDYQALLQPIMATS